MPIGRPIARAALVFSATLVVFAATLTVAALMLRHAPGVRPSGRDVEPYRPTNVGVMTMRRNRVGRSRCVEYAGFRFDGRCHCGCTGCYVDGVFVDGAPHDQADDRWPNAD